MAMVMNDDVVVKGGNLTSAIRHRANPNERCELCWGRYCLHLSLPRLSLHLSIHPSIFIFVHILFHQRQGKCLFPLQVGENTGALSFGTIQCLFAAEHHHLSIHTSLSWVVSTFPTFISPMSALPFTISVWRVFSVEASGRKWDIKIRAVVAAAAATAMGRHPETVESTLCVFFSIRSYRVCIYIYNKKRISNLSYICNTKRWCRLRESAYGWDAFGEEWCIQPDKSVLIHNTKTRLALSLSV